MSILNLIWEIILQSPRKGQLLVTSWDTLPEDPVGLVWLIEQRIPVLSYAGLILTGIEMPTATTLLSIPRK